MIKHNFKYGHPSVKGFPPMFYIVGPMSKKCTVANYETNPNFFEDLTDNCVKKMCLKS